MELRHNEIERLVPVTSPSEPSESSAENLLNSFSSETPTLDSSNISDRTWNTEMFEDDRSDRMSGTTDCYSDISDSESVCDHDVTPCPCNDTDCNRVER